MVEQAKREVLIPQYMKEFSCIGPACEDSCCVGWRVVIDEQTFKNYRKVRHPELKPVLDKKVTRIRSNASAENYAKVKMEKDGRCPFLTEDMWCNIQKNLGAEYLSNTCNYYPRTTNSIDGVLETSCTVSCPEATRQVLLNEQPLEFDQDVSSMYAGKVTRSLDTKKAFAKNPFLKHFWELRIFSIQVLQDRSYKVWERLIILGLFIQKLQELVEQEQVQETPNLIARWTAVMADGGLRSDLETVPEQTAIQMKLLKQLADKRFIQGINNSRYMECYKEMLIGLGYVTGTTDEQIEINYRKAYSEHYAKYMDEREYILENYLVNYVFKNMFPLPAKAREIFEEYVMLVIHYAMIKMHLIGIAGKNEGLTEELVIKLVQSFAKTVEHNSAFLKQIRELLKEHNLTTMAYMAILIKN